MKKAGRIILTVIGWLMMVLCALGCFGGIATLVNSGSDPETVRLTLLLALGTLAGFLIILRRKLFRRKPAAPQTGNCTANTPPYTTYPAKKRGGGWKLIPACFMYLFALMLLQGTVPLLTKLDRIYQSPAAVIGRLLLGLALLTGCILLTIHTIRAGQRDGVPVNGGLLIGVCIFVVLQTVVTETALHQEHNVLPSPVLSEQQSADLAACLENVDFNSFVYGTQTSAPEADGWIAVRLPGESGDDAPEDGQLIAWSGAHLWTGLTWIEARPTQQDIDALGTAALCRYGMWIAEYGVFSWASSGTRGSSEYVDIDFADLGTGMIYREERVGRELPGSVTEIPHYTVPAEELAGEIRRFMMNP